MVPLIELVLNYFVFFMASFKPLIGALTVEPPIALRISPVPPTKQVPIIFLT